MGSVLTRKFMLLAALLLIASRAPSAQQAASPIEPGASQTAVEACLRRSISLTVARHSQQPPTELGQVQVVVNGNQASTISSTLYSGPVRVLLLVDSSGSMSPITEGSGWGITLPTAAFAMDAVPLNAVVAVGRFAELLQLSPWQDRESAREQVLSLKYQSPKGKTALYSAVSEAASMFRGAQFGDTVYLITDGGENHSAVSSRRLVEDLVARGVRVFVFLVAPKQYQTAEEREGPRAMDDLANLTGGFVYRPLLSKEWLNSGEAAAAVKHIREQVALPYRIDFRLASPLIRETKLKLEAVLDPKLYSLAYPRRLEPCTAASPK